MRPRSSRPRRAGRWRAASRRALTYCRPIATSSSGSFAIRATPFVFVVIWSSGFVVARLVAPHAEPLTFLLVRYAGVVVLMLTLALAGRARWPSWRQAGHIAVAGIGIQAAYLGGVWVAVAEGMPASVTALVVNLQPVLTALVGWAAGERMGPRRAAGLTLGFLGVALVVSGNLTTSGITLLTLLLSGGALLAITAGTLYQKHFCPDFDLRTGQVVQFLAAIVVTTPFALAFEPIRIDWTPEVIGALLWSVLVLTGGGISLLFVMLRRGAASQVTTYFYLVPAITAAMAFLMFGERPGWVAVVGMAVTVVGVALAARVSDPSRAGQTRTASAG